MEITSNVGKVDSINISSSTIKCDFQGTGSALLTLTVDIKLSRTYIR